MKRRRDEETRRRRGAPPGATVPHADPRLAAAGPQPRSVRPLFLADWLDAVFIHFTVEPRRLQPLVPYELDLFEGQAIVSVVAFTQRRLRPAFGGRLGRAFWAPLSDHAFLNVRSYVRCGHDRGIYFLAEWIPNRLAMLLGPATYGLPYRLGKLRYRHDPKRGRVSGAVRDPGRRCLVYRASCAGRLAAAPNGSMAEFLLERYTAFTFRHGVRRRFRIDHEPWLQVELSQLRIRRESLLEASGDWRRGARMIAGHYSSGVHNVRIGWPMWIGDSDAV